MTLSTSSELSGDPFYDSTPARWLRSVVHIFYGIRILIEDNMGAQQVAASRNEKVIWIRSGLPFLTFRRLISDAVMYIEHGEAAAPMFAPATTRPWVAGTDGATLLSPN